MDSKDKKQLSEIDICDLFITPAIKNAGWDPMGQIRREVTLAPGPVVVRGNMSSRNKKKKKFADYVLSWEPGVPVAVVEAKDNNHIVSYGIQQALGYAEILQVPSAFSSNGDAFASHNKARADGEAIETELPRRNYGGATRPSIASRTRPRAWLRNPTTKTLPAKSPVTIRSMRSIAPSRPLRAATAACC